MMSLFRQPHKERGGRKRFVLLVLVPLFVLAVLALFHARNPAVFQGGALYLARPLFSSGNTLGATMRDALLLLHSKRTLVLENQKLSREIVAHRSEQYAIDILRAENERLRSLLLKDSKLRRTAAVILARPNQTPYDTLIIDAGTRAGITVGDRVAAEGGVVIGVVERVYAHTAVIQLLSSYGGEWEAYLGPDAIPIRALGQGGGNFIARVPKDRIVEEGMAVVLPAADVEVFGVIEAVESHPTEPFYIARFKNPVNVSELKWVEVLTES